MPRLVVFPFSHTNDAPFGIIIPFINGWPLSINGRTSIASNEWLAGEEKWITSYISGDQGAATEAMDGDGRS